MIHIAIYIVRIANKESTRHRACGAYPATGTNSGLPKVSFESCTFTYCLHMLTFVLLLDLRTYLEN